mmetsp:Transcript_70893/g.200097  ORF Transcript_70893/g.200097 Transcript_70893/m.200097 type:complete len:205 (-) Transcript_70893:157-771(-)
MQQLMGVASNCNSLNMSGRLVRVASDARGGCKHLGTRTPEAQRSAPQLGRRCIGEQRSGRGVLCRARRRAPALEVEAAPDLLPNGPPCCPAFGPSLAVIKLGGLPLRKGHRCRLGLESPREKGCCRSGAPDSVVSAAPSQLNVRPVAPWPAGARVQHGCRCHQAVSARRGGRGLSKRGEHHMQDHHPESLCRVREEHKRDTENQ